MVGDDDIIIGTNMMKVQKHADRPEGRLACVRPPLFQSSSSSTPSYPHRRARGKQDGSEFVYLLYLSVVRMMTEFVPRVTQPERITYRYYPILLYTHFVVKPAAPLSGLLLVVGVVGAVSSALLHPDQYHVRLF